MAQDLYHFTSQFGIEGICNDGTIRKGLLINRLKELEDNCAVSLTSDPSPIGHGLPDGRGMSIDEARKFKASHFVDGEYFSIDHTRYRLKVTISPIDPNLIYAADFHDPETLTGLEIAGYLPTNSNGITKEEMLQVITDFENKNIAPKGTTWWYYLSDINISKISEVAMKLPNGEYLSGYPTDFFSSLKIEMDNQNKKIYREIE